jgi:hypothetical protein
MSRHQVVIGSDGIHHRLIIDGVDLSDGLRAAQLILEAGHVPTLVCEPLIHEIPPTELDKATVLITEKAKAALIHLGWTPPGLGPEPDGGDPWTISYHLFGTTTRYNDQLCTCGLPESATIHHEPPHRPGNRRLNDMSVHGICGICHHPTAASCHDLP